MKVVITMKDPDGVYDSVRDAVKDDLRGVTSQLLDEGEAGDLIESRVDKVHDILSKWIEYQEYVRIEIDTETGTAKVLEV